MGTCAYEYAAVTDAIVDALRPILSAGEFIIRRCPFRWKTDDGVIPNGYEMFDADQICGECGWEIVHHYNHVAVVRCLVPEVRT